MADPAQRTDTRREIATVAVLALGFGLVGIDRFMIVTLFPVIAKDLSLGYGAIGTITGALSIAWGLAALFTGNLADRVGRRPVLVVSLLVFSTLIGASGLATGLVSLVLARVVMGLADGAFTPASIAATLAVSPEKRRGLNIGIQQMTALLFGLGFAPLLVAALLDILDWRWIFSIFVLPGLLLAFFVARLVPGRAAAPGPAVAVRSAREDFATVLRFRNIRLLMLLMLAWLTTLISVSAFLPNYLIDHLGLSFERMGRVMSAIGFGGALGTILLPWLSDRIGRKPVTMLATIGALVSLVALSQAGPTVPVLFACLFVAMGCVMALITLTVGPLCDETVPPALGATATGVVIASGELFGGGIAPIVIGGVAAQFGIEHILWLPIATLALAFLASLALAETRPVRTRPERLGGVRI